MTLLKSVDTEDTNNPYDGVFVLGLFTGMVLGVGLGGLVGYFIRDNKND